MSLEKIVVDNIKRIRKEKNISQEKLAELCETSTSYIGLMETYKNIPKLSTIERIAEALNVKAIELFQEQEELQPKNSVHKENIKIAKKIKQKIIDNIERELDDLLKMV